MNHLALQKRVYYIAVGSFMVDLICWIFLVSCVIRIILQYGDESTTIFNIIIFYTIRYSLSIMLSLIRLIFPQVMEYRLTQISGPIAVFKYLHFLIRGAGFVGLCSSIAMYSLLYNTVEYNNHFIVYVVAAILFYDIITTLLMMATIAYFYRLYPQQVHVAIIPSYRDIRDRNNWRWQEYFDPDHPDNEPVGMLVPMHTVPPCSTELVQALPRCRYLQGMFEESSITCPVCVCDFEEGEQIVTMGCLHHFHINCINRWLHRHNTCPICRLQNEKLSDEQSIAASSKMLEEKLLSDLVV